jgi:hypothetical protein
MQLERYGGDYLVAREGDRIVVLFQGQEWCGIPCRIDRSIAEGNLA